MKIRYRDIHEASRVSTQVGGEMLGVSNGDHDIVTASVPTAGEVHKRTAQERDSFNDLCEDPDKKLHEIYYRYRI
jgi:hypothetical protein